MDNKEKESNLEWLFSQRRPEWKFTIRRRSRNVSERRPGREGAKLGAAKTLEEESPRPGGRPTLSLRLQSGGAGLEVSALPVTSTLRGP